MFNIPKYVEPNFECDRFKSCPNATFVSVTKDGVAPKNYHATTIYPEYLKINDEWILAKGSRMDCVPVLRDNGDVEIKEFRDDGPLPNVLGDAYEAQNEMRKHTCEATTVICLATQLHTIATGNMTPSYNVMNGEIRPVYIYAVDVSEFVLNKIRDRGTLEVTTIVANIQDFLFKLDSFL